MAHLFHAQGILSALAHWSAGRTVIVTDNQETARSQLDHGWTNSYCPSCRNNRVSGSLRQRNLTRGKGECLIPPLDAAGRTAMTVN
jgi:hypothetical protein